MFHDSINRSFFESSDYQRNTIMFGSKALKKTCSFISKNGRLSVSPYEKLSAISHNTLSIRYAAALSRDQVLQTKSAPSLSPTSPHPSDIRTSLRFSTLCAVPFHIISTIDRHSDGWISLTHRDRPKSDRQNINVDDRYLWARLRGEGGNGKEQQQTKLYYLYTAR